MEKRQIWKCIVGRHQCHTVASGGEIDISTGDLVDDKRIGVLYFVFHQEGVTSISTETSISDLSLYPGIEVGLFDKNEKCLDPNAETIVEGGEIMCMCRGAFVSSNGGKEQGALDSCISCISSPNCHFEGDNCFRDDECVWGSCNNNRCVAISERCYLGGTHYT